MDDQEKTWMCKRCGETNVSTVSKLPAPVRCGGCRTLHVYYLGGPSRNMVGQEFAGFELGDLAGVNELGEYYYATHLSDGQGAMMQVLGPAQCQDDDLAEAFMEASVRARRVSHAKLVPITQSSESEGIPFCAWEFVAGESLSTLLAREHHMRPEMTRLIGSIIASGLEAVHEAGQVYGVVRPERILLCSGEVARLNCFGVESVTWRFPRVFLVDGWSIDDAYLYAAPETLRGGELSPQSDVYGLGASMFHMICGLPPYPARDVADLLARQAAEDVPSPRIYEQSVPAALAAVVKKALSREPEQRYENAHALRSALDELGITIGEGMNSPEEDREQPLEDEPARSVRREQQLDDDAPAGDDASDAQEGAEAEQDQDEGSSLDEAKAPCEESVEQSAAGACEPSRDSEEQRDEVDEESADAEEGSSESEEQPADVEAQDASAGSVESADSVESDQTEEDAVDEESADEKSADEKPGDEEPKPGEIAPGVPAPPGWKPGALPEGIPAPPAGAGTLPEGIPAPPGSGTESESEASETAGGQMTAGGVFIPPPPPEALQTGGQGAPAWIPPPPESGGPAPYAPPEEGEEWEEEAASTATAPAAAPEAAAAPAEAPEKRGLPTAVLIGLNTLFIVGIIILFIAYVYPKYLMSEEAKIRRRMMAALPRNILKINGNDIIRIKDSVQMVYVPAGSFQMGAMQGKDNGPQHPVYLDGYFIDKFEVNNKQYKAFCRATGHPEAMALDVYIAEQHIARWPIRMDPRFNLPEQPVAAVSWNDAMAYAKWVGGTLPSEVQWEKAARGEDGRKYPWGQKWYVDACNYAGYQDKRLFTARVGTFPAGRSPFGCYNMAGNVAEWCYDWYSESAYAMHGTSGQNLWGPSGGTERVYRGGSWRAEPDDCQVFRRFHAVPEHKSPELGFRVVVLPVKQE